MLSLEQSKDGLALVRHRPAAPLVIAGCLFGALGLSPLLSPAPLSGLTELTMLAFAAVGGSLIWLGRPRRERVPLPPELAKGRVPAPARVELSGSESYQALLVLSDGSQSLLFDRDEPAGVVRDVLALSERYSLPVRPGWLLDESAWAALRSRSGARRIDPPISAQIRPLARQRTAAYTSVWAGFFVLVVAIVMAISPYRSGVPPSTLAIALPALTVVAVLLIGAWLVGLRERLVVGGTGVEQQRLWFGIPLGRPRTLEATIHAVFPVAADGGAATHLLVATADGPIAFRADAEAVQKLAVPAADLGASAGRAAE